MRSMMEASASAASLPAEGGATTTLAPSVRNSCLNFCSASRLIFRSAEEIAAPLVSAIRATVSRPRLACSNCRKIRQNIDPERRGTSSLTPQYRRGVDARRALQRHQAAHSRQVSSLALGHLPYRANFDARKFLLHLVRNRGNVRAAIPAIVFGRRHFRRIAFGKSVRRLGQRAYQQAAVAVGTSGEVLRDFEWREDRIIFAAARGNNPRNGKRVRAFSGTD